MSHACDPRNCVQVGPIRRGAGPSPLWRSTVAMVVAETSIPSFRSLDSEVAPPRVLPTEAKDQVLDRGIQWRAAGPAGPTPAPTPRELSVPPDEGVRAHHEALRSIPGQQPGSGCQQRPICIGEARSDPSSTEDLQLVAEHGRLQIPLVDAAAQEQADQGADEPVAQRHEHQSKSERRTPNPLTARSGGPIEFLYPTSRTRRSLGRYSADCSRYGLALGWTTGRYPLRSTSAVDGGVSTVAPPREGRSSGEP